MKNLVDSERGHELIAQRFATVEPVFGNIRFNKALNRFTLRGQQSGRPVEAVLLGAQHREACKQRLRDMISNESRHQTG